MPDLDSAVIALGELALNFGKVDRATYHQDGTTPESDTDHTVMLGMVACALADRLYPEMDQGLIAQYALVHDLPEVYAGDTPTLAMPTAETKAEKEAREGAALARIVSEFIRVLPWVPGMATLYEARLDREARFVKAVDKVIPKVTHILNGGVTVRAQGMSREAVRERYAAQGVEMLAYAADFPELLALREALVTRMLGVLDA